MMNLNCLLFALFLGFGLLVLLYAFFAHFFIKPIKLLSIYAGKIASGDFSQKIYSHPKGELGVLSRSLQNLDKKIKGSVKEVDVNTNRLEAVLLSMFDGVLVTDASGNIVLINQSLKELLQITSPPEGKLPLEIIRNLEVQDIVEKTLQRKGFEKREVVLRLPEETNFIIHATPIMRAQKCDGVVLVFHNITELRKLETIRRDFVANASHELRTPIANIQGYSETLLEGAIGDKQNARRFLEVINSESKRVGQLIADLLDLSKMESGKLMVSPKPCDLALIIHNITEQFSKQALAKTISLKADFSPEMPFVFADENSLRQILVNLIDNSIKYTPAGGNVVVSVKDKIITVKDNGVGIPVADLDRVFERFYRVDKAHSRELGGTGLGLAIVKHLVQSMGGQVWLESVEGQGTSVSFRVEIG